MAKNTTTTVDPVKHQCSFCKKTITIKDQYDMPIFDPQTGFSICNSCIREIYHFISEVDTKQKQTEKQNFSAELDEIIAHNKPHNIKEYLDEYIINQDKAKKVLAVAVYNHYKRMRL